MTFDVAASAYEQFMGRYSRPLAHRLAELTGVEAGQRALDVGCGTGALASVLVDRLGASAVAGVDPSEPFIAEAPALLPGVDVRLGSAEDLPWNDGEFDRTIAELVVQFMSDPVTGLREMARVTRPGGVVAACVWHPDEGPLGLFWRAARDLDPAAPGEDDRPGVREGSLAELFTAAGMPGSTSSRLVASVTHPTFEEWWHPFTLGVGPAGAYVAALDGAAETALREHCRELQPDPPFVVEAVAWTSTWTSS